MYSHILIPTDGSGLADTAVEHGVKLAKALGAKVTIVIAIPPDETYIGEVVLNRDRTLSAATALAKAANVQAEAVYVENDSPYQAIIDTANAKGADLIVMASHGRKGVEALVLGSETMNVLTHCKIPVLVHR